MESKRDIAVERVVPTVWNAAVFRVKSSLLQVRRAVADIKNGDASGGNRGELRTHDPIIAESKTPLWTETEPEERHLVAGKIENLRRAVACLNGIEFGPGETFSFWRAIGRATSRRGFVAGRELREGCIVPNVGGGLCQLSNALYDAALTANFEIVERHAHSRVMPGSLAEQDRDATVFWNYIDLRFRSKDGFRIEASLSSGDLTVTFRGTKVDLPRLHNITRRGHDQADSPNSCATCGVESCFRVIKPVDRIEFGRTAFLVDEYSPEFNEYIVENRTSGDVLHIPIDGKRFRKSNYAWTTNGFLSVDQYPYLTALRSYRSRKLATQGASRQRNLLAMAERLAERYARSLRFDDLHVVVSQELLPHLWKRGHLGGRTFDVLMSALPMAEIQRRLDHAATLHPESSTLADFRADADLIAAETAALAAASRIITPHTAIAELFPDRTVLLDWIQPQNAEVERRPEQKPVIVFPASTVGRKGCYELREALSGMDVTLLTLGPIIESADFWRDHDTMRGVDDWLSRADLVVLPAFVEHRPRRLLAAVAAGIPVIASPECGVENIPSVTTIPSGNVDRLREAIGRHIAVKDR